MLGVQPNVRGTDVCDFDDAYSDQQHAADQVEPIEQPQVQRIDVRQSPYIDEFCGHDMVRVTIDSGATGNMIRQSTAVRLGCDINKSYQSAHQADGSSPLTTIGETSICLTRKNNKFAFTGLVVQNLDVEPLAGTPFLEINDVAIRPAKRSISLADGTTYTYGTTDNALNRHAIRCAHVLLTLPCGLTSTWKSACPPTCSLQTAHSLWIHGLIRMATSPYEMMMHGRNRRVSLALTFYYAYRT